MAQGRQDKTVNASNYWKIVFPILTLVVLLFVIFVIFAIPDWALTDKCAADSVPRVTRAIRASANA